MFIGDFLGIVRVSNATDLLRGEYVYTHILPADELAALAASNIADSMSPRAHHPVLFDVLHDVEDGVEQIRLSMLTIEALRIHT